MSSAIVTPPASPPAQIGVGSVVFNWRIERLIARGGMGIVYLGRHQFIGRLGALKVIAPPPGTVADPNAIVRFQTEVELHVSLRLPNLPGASR